MHATVSYMLKTANFREFFFQAEDGIRDAQESRGLGDVYKRQVCLNAQHSEVSEMFSYALLARLDPAQSRRKVTKNLLF